MSWWMQAFHAIKMPQCVWWQKNNPKYFMGQLPSTTDWIYTELKKLLYEIRKLCMFSSSARKTIIYKQNDQITSLSLQNTRNWSTVVWFSLDNMQEVPIKTVVHIHQLQGGRCISVTYHGKMASRMTSTNVRMTDKCRDLKARRPIH